MTKLTYRRTFASARRVSLGSLLALAFCFPAMSQANTAGVAPKLTLPAATQRVAAAPAPADAFPSLDSKRLFALGMIETGNDDRMIGSAGEVSRYQLAPPVWKSYSKSMDYRNPDMAVQVARMHWNFLASYYKEKTGRAPTDYDMYVLWNTRYGYYARHGFSRRAIALVVQDRASRFVNLINRRDNGIVAAN
jgi:hypothetical protein